MKFDIDIVHGTIYLNRENEKINISLIEFLDKLYSVLPKAKFEFAVFKIAQDEIIFMLKAEPPQEYKTAMRYNINYCIEHYNNISNVFKITINETTNKSNFCVQFVYEKTLSEWRINIDKIKLSDNTMFRTPIPIPDTTEHIATKEKFIENLLLSEL